MTEKLMRSIEEILKDETLDVRLTSGRKWLYWGTDSEPGKWMVRGQNYSERVKVLYAGPNLQAALDILLD